MSLVIQSRGQGDRTPDELELKVARILAQRIAEAAKKLKAEK